MIGLVSVAVIAVVATLVLGSLTAPPEVATEANQPPTTVVPEPPTTTLPFDIAQIERGEPVEWRRSLLARNAWPVAALEHGGKIYVFHTTETDFYGAPPHDGMPSGLQGWSWEGGTSWAELGGGLGGEARVVEVISTGDGLLAWGLEDDRPTVWTSEDGVFWTAQALPIDPALTGSSGVWPYPLAHADDDLMMVFGATTPNGHHRLEETLLAATGLRALPYGWGWNGPGQPVTIHGPLGMVLASYSTDELGLDEEQLEEQYFGASRETMVWSARDRTDWVSTTIPADYPNAVVGGHDGRTYLSSNSLWSTADGFTWEQVSGASAPSLVGLVTWEDRYVGYWYGSKPLLVVTDDLANWEPVDVFAVMPDDFHWWVQAMAAGEAGIGMILVGQSSDISYDPPEPVMIPRNGYTLTVSDGANLVIEEGDQTILLVPRWNGVASEWVVGDFSARTITFLNPKTGAELMNVSFDELDRAEAELYASVASRPDFHTALLFSPDGEAWSIQELDEAIFNPVSIPTQLVVTSDAVVMVSVINYHPRSNDVGFEVWMGTPPDR